MPDTKQKLKNIYVALARAVEGGDPLRIGIVLGQSLKQIEELINELHDSNIIHSTPASSQSGDCRD